jgi:protein-S-isoprenylcysteine O-methyltransferase Ste14
MKSLEHRIPPPLVALIVGVVMWVVSPVSPVVHVALAVRVAVALALGATGFVIAFSGFRAFGRAKTTVNPVNIEAASSLVTGGVYRYTRNPMYVGLTSLLLALTVLLSAPVALLGPIAFVLFTTRFQILPEERLLRTKFGDAYEEYQRKVRRWI